MTSKGLDPKSGMYFPQEVERRSPIDNPNANISTHDDVPIGVEHSLFHVVNLTTEVYDRLVSKSRLTLTLVPNINTDKHDNTNMILHPSVLFVTSLESTST